MDALIVLLLLLFFLLGTTCQNAAEPQVERQTVILADDIHVKKDMNDGCFIPFKSCWHITEACPSAVSGYYWVQNGTEQTVQVYCDMDSHCCNSTRGWMRVANVDMTDPAQQCPPEFTLMVENGLRVCGREGGFSGCTSTTFSSHGIEYDRVCGRIRAYQFGEPYAFYESHRSIDDRYVDGISITHGSSPRKHIWTFTAALSEYYSSRWTCPCTRTDQTFTGTVPSFIGSDYFCDTAVNASDGYPDFILHTDDPLWDGQGCGSNSSCCSFNNPPWFCTQLPQPTTDDIELRMCGINANDEDTPFDQLELYVQNEDKESLTSKVDSGKTNSLVLTPTPTSPSATQPILIFAVVASLLGGGAVTLTATLIFLKCFFCGKRHAADSNAEVKMDSNEAYVETYKCIPTAHSEENRATNSAPYDVFDTSVSTSQVVKVMEELMTDHVYAEIPALGAGTASTQTSDGAERHA